MGVRFAPSPTGKFHIGNLRTAVISHWWARALNLSWIVRFEDIDVPRVIAGIQEEQLQDLKHLSLKPDLIKVQSQNRLRHWTLFKSAVQTGAVYPCTCSRKELLESLASAPHSQEVLYSGRCRKKFDHQPNRLTIAWRMKTLDESGKSDFIIARSQPVLEAGELPEESGFTPAYHWACAIDDYDGRYSLLVRAIDLKPAATKQRLIMNWVAEFEESEFTPPAIFHTALVTADDGSRLEKRTRGVTLSELINAGHSFQGIYERLMKSFNQDASSFMPSKIYDERISSIPLSQLDLNPS